MNNIAYFVGLIILALSCRHVSEESRSIVPLLDSVEISNIHKNPNYKRYGFKAEYANSVFYLLVESIGDFYAVNNNAEILWKVSLNQYLDGPDGPSILYTSTEDFILANNSLYFLQNDKSIVEYDIDGNRKGTYPLQIERPGNALALQYLSGNRFLLLWQESFKPDYTSEYTIFEIGLSQSSSVEIFNKQLSYPRSRITFDCSGDGIYVFEDIARIVTRIQGDDYSHLEIPLPQTEWRDYTMREVYKGDVASYSNLNVFERRAFSNDYYRQAKIVEDHFFLHHYVYQRSETPNPFKDLITVQFPDGTNRDVLLQEEVVNLDDRGNYFSMRTNEDGIFLKISPILSSDE